MSPVGHALASWILALLFLKNPEDRNLVLVAGVSPDLDGFAILYSFDEFLQMHHTFGHNLWWGLLLALFALVLAKRRWKTAILVFSAVGLHLVCDLLATNWGFHPFYPWGPYLVNTLPPWVIYGVTANLLYVGLLVWAFVLMYRRETTPLEAVSSRFNEYVVRNYIRPLKGKCHCGKRAWFHCDTCGRDMCLIHSGDYLGLECVDCTAAGRADRRNGK